MVHKSLEALQLDQRLIRRRGWIAQEELERRLSDLPDVSDKIDRSEPGREEAAGTPAVDEGESP